MKGLLVVNKGNVILYNTDNQPIRHYYMKGNAIRADWYEPVKESVQIQLSTGEMIIMNIGCQVVKRINIK
jgi:hypothetical protein